MNRYTTLITFSLLLTLSCCSGDIDEQSLMTMLKSGKDIYVENKTFNSDVDFTTVNPAYMESPGMYRSEVSSSVTFKNCVFNGKVIAHRKDKKNNAYSVSFLRNATFINCSFRNETDFEGCIVYGQANIIESMFGKTANFENAHFLSDAVFSKSIFSEEARFQNTFFNNRTNFHDAFFYKSVSFQNAYFNLEASFIVAKFLGYADFSLINANSNIFFNYADFKSKAVFNNSKLNDRAEFSNARFIDVELKSCRFYGTTTFSNASAHGQMNLSGATFIFAKPDTTSLQTGTLIMEVARPGAVREKEN
jgi:uncharacterized protein YjbI with pentapeptide repeats